MSEKAGRAGYWSKTAGQMRAGQMRAGQMRAGQMRAGRSPAAQLHDHVVRSDSADLRRLTEGGEREREEGVRE